MALVGPKPLRFAAVKARSEPTPPLPLVNMTDNMSTNAPSAEEIFGPQPLDAAAASQTNLVESVPAPLEPAPAQNRQVTPETLLQFFTPGTQGNTVITTPVEFSPPAAGSGKSSTATYITQ